MATKFARDATPCGRAKKSTACSSSIWKLIDIFYSLSLRFSTFHSPISLFCLYKIYTLISRKYGTFIFIRYTFFIFFDAKRRTRGSLFLFTFDRGLIFFLSIFVHELMAYPRFFSFCSSCFIGGSHSFFLFSGSHFLRITNTSYLFDAFRILSHDTFS